MVKNRVKIFTGHYGSGKTEISINYAIKLKQQFDKVAIVDLDIVNPYFRTKDAQKTLEAHGIRVIAPVFANTNVEIPILPPDIISLFQDPQLQVVFDVGGDETGATVLGTYNQYFLKESYDMYFVVNTRRPLTQTTENIIQMLRNIEMKSRLKVNGLVNNTNLSTESTLEILLEGAKTLEEVAETTGIQLKLVTGKSDILEELPKKYEEFSFPLNLYLQLPW